MNSPGDERSRPSDETEAAVSKQTGQDFKLTSTVTERPPCRPHLRRHFCYLDVKWRRRESAELTRLIRTSGSEHLVRRAS